MYEDLVTTKMDLFIDEEYWVEKGKEDILILPMFFHIRFCSVLEHRIL